MSSHGSNLSQPNSHLHSPASRQLPSSSEGDSSIGWNQQRLPTWWNTSESGGRFDRLSSQGGFQSPKERWIKSKLSANICMFTYLLSRWGPTHSSYGVLQTNDSLFGHANWVLLAAVASLKGDEEPAFNPDGRQETFDASSYPVGIDNRASSCLSSNLPDFVPGTLKPSNRVVRTYNGHLMGGLQEGTIKWSVQDDLGGQHDWLLPKSHYVPGNGTSRLLSPQHWAQCMPRRWKANCDTGAEDMTLKWEDHQAVPHTITCPLDPRTNVL